MKKPVVKTIDDCMEILEWFGDTRFEHERMIWLTRTDSDVKLAGILPALRKYAAALVIAHRDFEDAYPEAGLAA